MTVKDNEHAVIEKAYAEGYAAAHPPKLRTGKKVAVIGSGPAGLAAADQLNKRGHSVTVFERSDRLGGLLMYGIPNMKLEKWVIERKISVMKEEGVSFVVNADVGKNYKVNKILRDFDRVILACGAQLILAILLYLPFFKIMERQELREEEARAKKAEEAKNIFSDDEEALLNDLDLDF